MRDFDFFGESRPLARGLDELAVGTELPADYEQQLASFDVRRRRAGRRFVGAGTLFFLLGAATWLFADWVTYSLFTDGAPLELGEITEVGAAQLEHNQLVAVRGITEHRGMTQKLVLGPSFEHVERWYFRLVGSRGVFVEVPTDPQRFGPAFELTVRARVVDVERSPAHARLIERYDEKFGTNTTGPVRVLQVGVEPGVYAGRSGMLLAALATSLVVWLAAAWQLTRIHRDRPKFIRRAEDGKSPR